MAFNGAYTGAQVDAAIAGMNSGVIGFSTKALMDADLDHDDAQLADVTNDSSPENNGRYRKSGASGSGSWVASASVGRRPTGSAAGITALRGITGSFSGEIVYLEYRSTSGDGGEGNFRWDSSDLSAEVTEDTQSGIYVAPDSDATGASGCWVRQYNKTVDIVWFGATNEAEDNLTAINAAISYANTVDKMLYIGDGDYFVSGSLYGITSGLLMTGRIVYTGAADSYATVMTLGQESAVTTDKIFTGINIQRSIQSDWAEADESETDVAVYAINLRGGKVQVVATNKFTIALRVAGKNGKGSVTEFDCGILARSKVGIDIVTDSTGYVNACRFISPEISVYETDINTSINRYGIRFGSGDGDKLSNVFYAPTIQLKIDGGTADGYPIQINKGRENNFLDCYLEYNDGKLMEVTTTAYTAYKNKVTISNKATNDISVSQVDDGENGVDSDFDKVELFDSGLLGTTAIKANATQLAMPGLIIKSTSNTAYLSESPRLTGILSGDGVQYGATSLFFGVIVDVSVAKTLIVRWKSSDYTAVSLYLYDNTDTLITDATEPDDIATSQYEPVAQTAYRWSGQTDLTTKRQRITFGDRVKKVYVGICAKELNAVVDWFKIYSNIPASVIQTLGSGKTTPVLIDEATPSVKNGDVFLTGGTTAITDFIDGVPGQEICIVANHSVTITDGATIRLTGGLNYAMTSGDTLILKNVSDVWYQVGGSVNN
jgi:hypothetical protein